MEDQGHPAAKETKADSPSPRSVKGLKAEILRVLCSRDREQSFSLLSRWPARQVINPLFSFFLHPDPEIHWAAVTAMGRVVADLALRDMESARVVLRRLIWQLNDESGGIGWGCAQAMGEILACHEGLAKEFSRILISYIRRDGNYLDYDPLLQGAVWGIGRLAEESPHLTLEASAHLLPFLHSQDPILRGLAVWALGKVGPEQIIPCLEPLSGDRSSILIYKGQRLQSAVIRDLVQEAILRLAMGTIQKVSDPSRHQSEPDPLP